MHDISPKPAPASFDEATLKVLQACGQLAKLHEPFNWRCGACGMPCGNQHLADHCCNYWKGGRT